MQANIDATAIEEVFRKQKAASMRLKQRTVQERLDSLRQLKEWIKSNREKIKEAVWDDLKKPSTETDLSEIYVVLSEISYVVKWLPKWAEAHKIKGYLPLAGSKSYIQMEPKGMALIISPWNYPFNLAVGPLVSAVAAGCTVILKPSEMAPSTSRLISGMVSEVFREEEVTVIEGGPPVVHTLLSKPFDHVFFTGSPTVGKSVMKAASEHLTSVTLELGGKSPVLIDKACKISEVAERVVWGKFLNCGQTCVAPDYVLVHETEADRFFEEVKVQVRKMFNPKDRGTVNNEDYGRIINPQHLERLQDMLSEALDKGAQVVLGGEVDKAGNYMAPTVLREVRTDLKLMQEEIFGPLLPVLTYSDIDEAIAFINSKPKPLAIYVFSEEDFFSDYVLTHTSSGTAVINDCAVQFGHPGLPFGGVGQSGMGKSHGYYGFLAFSNQKAVLHQKTGFTPVRNLYPPYGFKKRKIVSLFLRFR
jgi:aldehyde dehydrogenase (NAD+)